MFRTQKKMLNECIILVIEFKIYNNICLLKWFLLEFEMFAG